jgi:ubiquitin carboxyl-terminal hydrolase MINDY-1/2
MTQRNDSLLDRGQHNGVVSLADELDVVPNAPNVPPSQPSLLDDDEPGPAPPVRPASIQREYSDMYAPPEGSPPTKPPRPAVTTKPLTDAEIARLSEERSETYQIKHFNWFDHGSGRLRRSSMLTQNKNGPCPLLALVNALILGAKDESQAALDDALRTREQVSLGLIIETLMYELIARNDESGEQLPDVDELNAFLMRLRTGMNANPRFVSHRSPAPNLMDARNSMLHLPQQERNRQRTGTFESTPDMRLYGAFSVPLLHGWLPEPGSDALEAFTRSAQTYEDAQAIQFGEEELDYKLSHDGLTPDEQRVWEDINSIKNFLKQYPTQLTPYGLELVQETLSSGSFAIMFRNDHFSTIYKHPQSGQLFTLITDAGYADRDEVIWESLMDVSGSHNEFFSGDFMPVSHSESNQTNATQSQLNHQQHLTVPDSAAPLSPQEQQEQHDADFAMALQLQEEEEQHQRAETARRRRSGAQAGPQNQSGQRLSPRASQGNIPITIRPVNSRDSDAPANRPLIPPRNQRTQVQGVNRPADASGDDAPPAYEEAAKAKAYIPPVGSPLHPSSEPGASPMSSNVQLTGTTSNISNSGAGPSLQPPHPPGPNAPSYAPRNTMPGGRGQRRSSAYHEQTTSPINQMPGAYNWEGRSVGRLGGVPAGRRQGEEKCSVM